MASNLNLFGACLVFLLIVAAANADRVLNLKRYSGVSGDGKHDCTKALQQMWNDACASDRQATMLIPNGNYVVGPVLFKGKCKVPITIKLDGNLLADTNLNRYTSNWLEFQYINGLTITGKGKFDGQGATAWPHNTCPKNWKCKLLPMSLVFSFVTDMKISGVSLINSKLFHLNMYACNNVEIRSIHISAPGDSPNTDGIHMGQTKNVVIADSVIGAGDDCVSIGSETDNVTVTGVTCGPGHGISVGSLGKDADKGDVTRLTVRNCTLIDTTNGIRIKTWQSKPNANAAMMKVSDFSFEDIVMRNVYNPIIIDQEYCPYASCSESMPSRVKISGVKFRNIRGTSNSAEVIKLVCSKKYPCQGVELRNIDLKYTGTNKALKETATCHNVKVLSSNVKPVSCL